MEGGDLNCHFPIGLIWNSCVPLKVCVFTWEVWWGKVLTADQLKKRGFQLASRCPLCQKDEETLEHLLIHSPAVWCLWATPHFFSKYGLGLPPLSKRLDDGLDNISNKKESKKNLEGSPPSPFWVIWKEINRVVFENENFSSNRLKQSFITSLAAWAGLICEGDYSIISLLLCIL